VAVSCWLFSIVLSRAAGQGVKSSEENFEAFDLTGGLRPAAALLGCDHKTVADYVAFRDTGMSPDERPRRAMAIDTFPDKVEEWIERPRGSIRADVAHRKLLPPLQ
jgi:hypothetical protein